MTNTRLPRLRWKRAALVLAPLVAALVLDAAPFTAQRTAAQVPDPNCALDDLDQRCEKWTQTYGRNGLSRMVLSPTGDRIFLGGGTFGIAATEAADGAKLWEAKLKGTGTTTPATGPQDIAVVDFAVSPDGARVYAIGQDVATNAIKDASNVYHDTNVIVAAYDAATGTQLWWKELGLPGIDEDPRILSIERAGGIAVSPDGNRVYITGNTVMYDWVLRGRITLEDVLLAGFDAGTGDREWLSTWGNRFRLEFGNLLEVAPDSRTLYVGGLSRACDYLPPLTGCPRDLLAMRVKVFDPSSPATEGEVLWGVDYDAGVQLDDDLVEMDVAPDASRVYLTEVAFGGTANSDFDWATVALQGSDGKRAWEARHSGPDLESAAPHRPAAILASPAGDRVFVTGQSTSFFADGPDGPAGERSGDVTVAYGAANGTKLWEASGWPGLLNTGARALAASPSGDRLYLLAGRDGAPQSAGSAAVPTAGPVTMALNPADGDQLWVARGRGTYNQVSRSAIAVAPDGKTVYTALGDWSLQAYEVEV